MNYHYYKEACMCRTPQPSRVFPGRCAWCGGILPPAVRAMFELEEMARESRGSGVVAVLVAILVLAALVAVGRITLVASQHDPTPPVFSAEIRTEEVRP